MNTSLISKPDTKPSLSESLLAKIASKRIRSAGVTTQSTAGGDPSSESVIEINGCVDGTLFCKFDARGMGGIAGGTLPIETGNAANTGGTGGGGAMSFGKFAMKPLSVPLDFRDDFCNSGGNVCGTARLSNA